MKLRSLTARRPSPAIVISSAALFMSLGGVGYAATSLPNNSVGSNQIRTNAVTYQKIAPNSIGRVRLNNNSVVHSKLTVNSVGNTNIIPGSVGYARADLNQLQARVGRTCATGSAIGAISDSGTPTCNTTAPAEYGATDLTTTLSSGAASTVASKVLPAGPDYLAFADTQLTTTSGGAAGKVTISCTLTVGSGTQTRVDVVNVSGTPGQVSNAALPLQVAGTAGTATETCTPQIPSTATGATVSVTSGLNAIQTSSNN